MNRNDDIERVLEQWFTEGPRHMSDRLFDGTLERIERLPKRRLAGLLQRLPAMTRNVRLAAAAALIVVLAGVGLAIVRVPSVGPAPTPSPSATSHPSVLSPAVTASLPARWMSVGTRLWTANEYPENRYSLTIDATTIQFPQMKGDVVSRWSADPAGGMNLRIDSPQELVDADRWKDCRSGDEGLYGVGLSQDGGTLTFSPVRDGCGDRSMILAGDWTRWPCAVDGPCLTELPQGLRTASQFRPFGGGATGWLSFTVGTGWGTPYVAPTWTPYADGLSFYLGWLGSAVGAGINVYSSVEPFGRSARPAEWDTCEYARAVTAPMEIAAWLATISGIDSTAPTPVEIGGLSGAMVDLSVPLDFVSRCVSYYEGGSPTETERPVFGSAMDTFDGIDGIESGQKARYIVLDAREGRIVVVEIKSEQAEWSDLVAAAMPIVESFEFVR